MFTEIWTVLTLATIALAFPLFAWRALERRKKYCGKRINPCFWCGRDCTYHPLVKFTAKDAAHR